MTSPKSVFEKNATDFMLLDPDVESADGLPSTAGGTVTPTGDPPEGVRLGTGSGHLHGGPDVPVFSEQLAQILEKFNLSSEDKASLLDGGLPYQNT